MVDVHFWAQILLFYKHTRRKWYRLGCKTPACKGMPYQVVHQDTSWIFSIQWSRLEPRKKQIIIIAHFQTNQHSFKCPVKNGYLVSFLPWILQGHRSTQKSTFLFFSTERIVGILWMEKKSWTLQRPKRATTLYRKPYLSYVSFFRSGLNYDEGSGISIIITAPI